MSDENDNDSAGDYEVGRGKPPKHSQWKKGQSGNPRGRRPMTTNLLAATQEALSQKVILSVNGKPKRMTMAQAIAGRAVFDAAKGKPTSLRFIVEQSKQANQRNKTEGWTVKAGVG
jgi:hypothetical protein